nr:hypothetical protein Iba_chr06aCG20170 [Ipomoea batatas]
MVRLMVVMMVTQGLKSLSTTASTPQVHHLRTLNFGHNPDLSTTMLDLSSVPGILHSSKLRQSSFNAYKFYHEQNKSTKKIKLQTTNNSLTREKLKQVDKHSSPLWAISSNTWHA